MKFDPTYFRTMSQKLFLVIILFSIMLVPFVIMYNRSVETPPQAVTQDSTGNSQEAETKIPTILTEHPWEFIRSEYDGTVMTPKQSGIFVMTFSSDNTFRVSTDCNTLHGRFTLRGFSLTFDEIITTEMYCEGSQDTAFAQTLSGVHAYALTESGGLELRFAKSGVATFVTMLTSDNTEMSTSTPVQSIPKISPTSTPITKGCFVGGCSSELCSESNDMVSTCIWKEEFACYQNATCERQPTGKCGWTKTPELNACINARENDAKPQMQ